MTLPWVQLLPLLLVPLLVGAGLLVRSFAALVAVDGGFSPDNLLTTEIRLPPSEYEPARRVQFFTTLVEQIEALPGVTGVAAINQLPVRDPGNNIYVYDARNPPEDPSASRTALIHPRTGGGRQGAERRPPDGR